MAPTLRRPKSHSSEQYLLFCLPVDSKRQLAFSIMRSMVGRLRLAQWFSSNGFVRPLPNDPLRSSPECRWVGCCMLRGNDES
jgi:hypothetical protein